MLELFPPLSAPKFANDVTGIALTPQHVLVTHQSLQSYRSPGVDPTRTDSDLRTKAIPEPIRKSGAGIPESSSRVHPSDERGSVLFGFSDDRVGVVGRMRVYVFDRS